MQLACDNVDTRHVSLLQSIYRGTWQAVSGTPDPTNALVKANTYDTQPTPGLVRNNIALEDRYSDNGKIIQLRKIMKVHTG